MARGRPLRYATEQERVEARRAQVRQHVRAYRRRKAKETSSSDMQSVPDLNSSDLTTRRRSDVTLGLEKRPSAEAIPFPDQTLARLPPVLDLTYQYKIGYLTFLQNRYIPASKIRYQSEKFARKDTALLCHQWLSAACDLVEQGAQGVIHDALLALACSAYDHEIHAVRPSGTSLRLYNRAIRNFQITIDSIDAKTTTSENDRTFLAMACAALASLEAWTNNHSLFNWAHHMHGMGTFIKLNGPNGLSRLGQEILIEYRALALAHCFWTRSSCFLADKRWIDVRWKRGNTYYHTYYDRLIDQVFPILPTMEKFDKAKNAESLPDILALREDLLGHRKGMENWYEWLRAQEPDGLYRMTPSEWSSEFGTTCFPLSLNFKNFPIAVAFTYFCVYSVPLEEMILEAERRLLQVSHPQADLKNLLTTFDTLLTRSRKVCLSLEWFWAASAGMIGREASILAFETGLGGLLRCRQLVPYLNLGSVLAETLDREIAWCLHAMTKYRKQGLPLFKFASIGSPEIFATSKTLPYDLFFTACEMPAQRDQKHCKEDFGKSRISRCLTIDA
ncbi:MAG: hypothetical protein Q9227_006060 [Pyrenula ochraceoflavens]